MSAVRTVTFSAGPRMAPSAGAGVGPVVRPSAAALLPILAGSQMQLQAVAERTHGTMQKFIEASGQTISGLEERSRQLESELRAAKAAHETDRVAHAAQLKKLEQLVQTLVDRDLVNRDRISALEAQTKYIRPTVKALISYGAAAFKELEYPGIGDDYAQRKPILQARLTAAKLEHDSIKLKRGIAGAKCHPIYREILTLEAELLRITTWEAREAKAKDRYGSKNSNI